MNRGGRRRRWINQWDAAVWCGGRWGRRRARTSECWAILRAEDVYTGLLQDDASRVQPGAQGNATYKFKSRDVTANWEIRANAVWRRGRVFLGCPRCGRRCTRLYVPREDLGPACRRCWGLTYASRTLQNYKDSLWGRGALAAMFGTSQRDWAYQTTDDARTERLNRCRNRWAERRPYLRDDGTTILPARKGVGPRRSAAQKGGDSVVG